MPDILGWVYSERERTRLTMPDLVYRDEPAYSLAEVRALFPAGHPLHQLATLGTHLAEHPAIRAVTWEGYAYRHEQLVDLIVLANPTGDQVVLRESLWRFGTQAAGGDGCTLQESGVTARGQSRRERPGLHAAVLLGGTLSMPAGRGAMCNRAEQPLDYAMLAERTPREDVARSEAGKRGQGGEANERMARDGGRE